MSRALNPADIRAQVEALRFSHPDVCDDAELFQLALESETDLHEFMAGIVERMRAAETMTNAQTDEIKDLTTRRDRYRARHEAMRTLAFKVMQLADVKKLELVRATLSIYHGPQKVIVIDFNALPEDCIRVKREPDKTAIKQRIAAGTPVPGAEMSNAEPALKVTPT